MYHLGGGSKDGTGNTSRNTGMAGVSATNPSLRSRVDSECSMDDACPVCLNRIRIFSVGLCNHHVCQECSTRMRVLCGQNECPICRQDMPKVSL